MEQTKKSILCVDDEKIPLFLRVKVLEKAGFEVLSASSAGEAMEIIGRCPIDLVLTDLLMPGVGGDELARQVKSRWPKLPVIVFSGVNELPPEASSADLFLSKLEGPTVLCDKIAEVLKAARGAA